MKKIEDSGNTIRCNAEGIRNYPEVEPGSIVTLTMNAEKVRKEAEPKEKVDLESTLAKALSSITSVVSILLLATRL